MNKINVAALFAGLSVPVNTVKKRKYQFIVFSHEKPFCILLHEGVVSIIRQSDNMLIKNYTAPCVIGLNFYKQADGIYIRAATDIAVESVLLCDAKEKLDQNKLWKHVSLLGMQIISNTIDYHHALIGGSAREIIINTINYFQKEPCNIQTQWVLAEYIVGKTNLSRSSVMKTLADLKKEGRLKTTKGIYISFK